MDLNSGLPLPFYLNIQINKYNRKLLTFLKNIKIIKIWKLFLSWILAEDYWKTLVLLFIEEIAELSSNFVCHLCLNRANIYIK
jgi:hypothetical protein